MRWCAVALVLALGGCEAKVPEGKLVCDTAGDCPSGWLCLAGDHGQRCYSSEGALNGGALDRDAGVDGSAGGNLDGGSLAGSGGSSGSNGGLAGSGGGSGADGGGLAGPDGGIGSDGGGMSSDPCDTDNGGCDPLVTCNSNGSTVTCDECPTGYDDTNGDGTSCAIVDCGALTAPTNGSVDATSGTTYDETATYDCDTGYAVSGSATLTCEANGNWSGSAPTCEDIDECLGNPCDSDGDSSSICAQDPTPGDGYSCTCTTGYAASAGSSPTCVDVDACSGSPVCTADYPCQDLTAPATNYTCRGQYADWAPSDAPSTFTVNANGTVSDSRSGLEWQQTVDASTYSWMGAKTHCADLPLAGGGWRLPTMAELESIVDFGRVNPAIDPTAFPSAPAALFWSSSAAVGGSGYAWNVSFIGGHSEDRDPSLTYRVRCVRSNTPVTASAGSGGAPPGRYTDNANGTVSDTLTQLTWQQAVPAAPVATGCAGTTCTQAGALAYCAALTLAGGGWRLPAVSELLTLVDPTLSNPPVDATAFSGTPTEWFWSSSTYVGAGGSAWAVTFTDGASDSTVTTNTYRVRCLR